MTYFNLNLVGEGVSINRSISKDAALAIMEIALRDEPSIHPVPRKATSNTDTKSSQATEIKQKPATLPGMDETEMYTQKSGRVASVREYIDKFHPQTNAQNILILAAYLLNELKQDSFSRADVRSKFPKAGIAIPKNYNRDFQTAEKLGWINEDPEAPSQFYITRKGEAALSEGFSSRRN